MQPPFQRATISLDFDQPRSNEITTYGQLPRFWKDARNKQQLEFESQPAGGERERERESVYYSFIDGEA